MCGDDNNMKKCVDKILDGETAVKICGFGSGQGLFISCSQAKDHFSINLDNTCHYTSLYIDNIKHLGEKLIEFVEEIEGRKFKDNDTYFYIDTCGKVCPTTLVVGASTDMARLYMGNAFKTRTEAEAHKDEIMSKYKKVEHLVRDE